MSRIRPAGWTSNVWSRARVNPEAPQTRKLDGGAMNVEPEDSPEKIELESLHPADLEA
jgi:hypothetical protein